MALTDDSNLVMPVAPCGNNGGFGGMNDGGWWIILLFIILGGWGNNRGWGNGNNGGGISENYALISDNATLERKIDGVYSGVCDSTFALNNAIKDGFASNTNVMTQGFAGLNTGIMTQGYETRNAITQDTIANMQGFNSLQGAVKDCCCQTQQNIKDVSYNIGSIGSMLGKQISDTGFAIERQVERGFADTNYNMATQNCATLTAIDKVGDRIIEFMTAQQTQALRDENNALRLAASQQAQNNYLVSQLKAPCPIPAYTVPNPNCCYQSSCGCNG